MLDHIATRFGTVAACLGAFVHVLVVGGLFASGTADVASLGTRLADGDSQRTLAGGDLGGGRTKLRAVRTSLQRRQMFLLPGSDETDTMVRSRLALAQAIGADPRAFLQGTVMVVVALFHPARAVSCQDREPSSASPQ
jgi:hypothetical protein